MRDLDRVSEAIRHAQSANTEIPDGVARTIAAWHHGGVFTLGYSFVSTGAIPDNPSDLWDDLFPAYEHLSPFDKLAADALDTYLLGRYDKGPIPHWHRIWA